MKQSSRSSFLAGLAGGTASALIGTLALLYLAARTELIRLGDGGHAVPAWFAWIDHNLGLSLPVFAIVFVLFMYTLGELERRLRRNDSPDRIAQVDHLADIWISLFFGTGVIWTAIGMRNALLYAIGDPLATLDEGALALLERMVDGGILVALSTTIFGGVGGYLMRVLRTVLIGGQLRRSYAHHSRVDSEAIRASLDSMNTHLEQLAGARRE